MAIRINRATLIQDILEYKEVFDALMQNIDDNNTANEFDTRLYNDLYYSVICERADNYQKDRMSLQSLLDNGIFVHSNLASGTTAMQSTIVKFLLFISEKKTVAMSHAGFNRIRAGFEALKKDIIFNGNVTDDNYRLNMNEFNSLLTDTIDEIKQSISALKQSVVDLSEVYKEVQGESYEGEIKLLEKISYLHTHFAIPCYQFIDQDIELDEGLSVTQSVASLIKFHEEHGADETALSLRYNLGNITSYYKDIEHCVNELDAYSHYLSQSRHKYMALDAAFENMMVSVRALRHGRRNSAKFKDDMDFLHCANVFDGMFKKPLFQQRFNWIDDVSVLRLDEWIRSETGKEKKVNSALLKPIHEQMPVEEKRRAEISLHVMRNLRLPEHGVTDVVEFVHQWMLKKQENYVFVDLLPAIQAFYGLYSNNDMITHHEKRRIIHQGYYFDYLRVEARGNR